MRARVDEASEVLDSGAERYAVIRELGRGGFGVTHLARRVSDGAEVVVKRLRMERLDDWKAFDLFEREAKVLEGLRHDSIPAFIDHFELKDGARLRGFALVQTFVEGRCLSELREEQPRAAILREWLESLLEVCEYLHGLEPAVIHRDIAPKNIIIRPDGQPVLIDFGAVQNVARSASTVASTAAGTFGYAAPEQLLGRAVPASDLYGLAMTYLAVATGQEPETLPMVGNRVDVSAALGNHDTHPRLALLLEAMTEPDPARRPATAAEVLNRVREIPAEARRRVIPISDSDDPATTTALMWRARHVRAQAVANQVHEVRSIPELERFAGGGIGDQGTEAVVGLGFMEGGAASLDLQTYALQRWSHGVSDLNHANLVPEADVRGVLLASFSSGAFLRRTAEGKIRATAISGLPMMMGRNRVGEVALSPDGTSLACLGRGQVCIIDLGRGEVVQTLSIDDTRTSMSSALRFTPDGAALLLESFANTAILDPSGGIEVLEDHVFALGNDGCTVAWADRSALYVGHVDTWVPFAWRERPRRVVALGGRVEHLRFSPDDARVVFSIDNRVGVVDLAAETIELSVGDPYRPALPFRFVEHAGVSADGRRLLVFGSCFLHSLASERVDCIAVYSLSRRCPLGTVVRLEDSDIPYGFTTLGVHGPLSGTKKGRASGKQARRLLLDEPPEDVLAERADAAMDFADRVGFWGRQVGDDGGLDEAVDLRRLVAASAGLTGLLPVAVQRAKQSSAGTPARFGESGPGGGEQGLLAALDWLRSKSDAERDVLFEDALPELIARAQAAGESAVDRTPPVKRGKLLLLCALASVLLVSALLWAA